MSCPEWIKAVGMLLCCFGAIRPQACGTLIHQWNFNETSGTNFADSIGEAPARVVVVPGGGGHQLTNGAVRLDGGHRDSADYVELPASALDGLTDITVEIWATPYSFLNWSRVFEVGPSDNVPDATENIFRLSFSVASDGNQQRYGLRPFSDVESFLPTQPGQQYHYVLLWAGPSAANPNGVATWYRDGRLVGGTETSGKGIANLADLAETVVWLGRSHSFNDETANAAWSEVRIYDELLDGKAIAYSALKGPDLNGPNSAQGLIHRWSFSDAEPVLTDSVGSAHGQIVVQAAVDHTLTNGTLELAGGDHNTADYAEFPAGLLSGLSNLTVEAWITPRSYQQFGRAFDFGSGTGPGNSLYLSLCRDHAPTGLNQQRLAFDSHALDTNVDTPAGQQHHYVVTWEAPGGTNATGRLAWYRDAVRIGSVDTGANSVADVDDTVLWLGRSQNASDATADAVWDELRIYNRVLNPLEINLNYQLGPDALTIAPPVANDDSIMLNPGAMALVSVLGNDESVWLSANSVMIESPPAHGTAEVKPGGSILYVHDGGAATSDQFTYTGLDAFGNESAPATVFMTINPAVRLPNTTITVPDTPPPVAYQAVDALPGLPFTYPMALRTPPGNSNQLFVVEKHGVITFVPDVTAPNPVKATFLDISDKLAFDDGPFEELGLQSMTFHPGFSTNGVFFVFYTASNGVPYADVLSRFTVVTNSQGQPILDNPVADPASEQILLSIPDEAPDHNAGDLHFGPDGYLYFSTGDEGFQLNTLENAQRIDKDFFSGIHRIDVDKRPGNLEPNPHPAITSNGGGLALYSIPADNPFIGATNFNGSAVDPNLVRTEFWAVGLRHAWRLSFDEQTGELWLGDSGQDTHEEINLVTPGGNYGWAYREGAGPTPGIPSAHIPLPPPEFTSIDPVWTYPHTGQGADANFSGNSVIGGRVYYGDRLPEFNGAYIFADFVTGNLWALRRTNGTVNVQRIMGEGGICAFGVDPANGDLLMADHIEGKIKRLVKSDALISGFPAKLSHTGIFADLATLAPNPGVLPYDLNVPFWSDHALKRRWFTIPDPTNTITFAHETNWTFPSGTKWFKHFDIELERGNPATLRRLETRVLVKTEESIFGVSYKWNETQEEAFLVGEGGDTFPVTILIEGVPVEQPWEIPSRQNCEVCHTAVGGHALGFNTRQLNRNGTIGGTPANQLDALSDAGYFDAPVTGTATFPAHASATDTNASVEFRVRSYLAVNCAQCHQPGGAAPATWRALAHLKLADTGLINGTPDNDGGNPANKLVVPGDPAHSVLLQRIQAGGGFSRMPPVATHEFDQTAIQLLETWITQELPNRLDYEQWRQQQFDPPTGPLTEPSADFDADGADNFYEFLTRTDATNAQDAWLLGVGIVGEQVAVSYQQVPNLGVLIESSSDFVNWLPWSVPGNQPFFGTSSALKTLTGSASDLPPQQFFRARLIEP